MSKPGNVMASSSKTKFKESEDSEISSSEEEEEIERELADVTFEELQKARFDGSHSVYRKPSNQEMKAGRANKNRPMEVTSKKPVTRYREVIQVPKKVVRDPRFETLSGNLDEGGFKKRYNFLYKDELPAEREELKKNLKKSKDPKVVEELKSEISRIDKMLKSQSVKRTDATILAEHKRQQYKATSRGKQPFYLKKSDVRKQLLIEKYNNLKASGKLDSFIEKRRRKNASKDHRYMPYRRTNNSDQQ